MVGGKVPTMGDFVGCCDGVADGLVEVEGVGVGIAVGDAEGLAVGSGSVGGLDGVEVG